MIHRQGGELIWYGRLGVWVGTLILLIQSVLGRSAGPSTTLGAVVVSAGLLAFLSGLAAPVLPKFPALVSPIEEPGTVEEATVSDVTVSTREDGSSEPRVEEPDEKYSVVPASVATTTQQTLIPTFEVRGDTEARDTCPGCLQPLVPGVLAVRCQVCSAPQHAHCWTDNRFQCVIPGCSGAGSLGAPES